MQMGMVLCPVPGGGVPHLRVSPSPFATMRASPSGLRSWWYLGLLLLWLYGLNLQEVLKSFPGLGFPLYEDGKVISGVMF